MEKFKFNFDLIACLSSVLDLTVAEIARRCNINQPTLRLYVERQRIIPVQTVFGLCNTLRMPTRYLFYENDTAVIPTRERATIEASRWEPVRWDYEAVDRVFGDAPRRIYWKDAATAMGLTEQKPRGRFALKTRFPVTDFLRVCNAFNLSPYTFILDHNPIPGDSAQPKSGKRSISAGSSAKDNDLRADIADLHRKIDSLSATVADLTKKYTDLLTKYDTLSRNSTSYDIHHFKDSNIAFAAEPTPPPYGIKSEENK